MSDVNTSGYSQVHLRLPSWLMERITSRAEAIGQTPSAEIRRALVESFGERPKTGGKGIGAYRRECSCSDVVDENPLEQLGHSSFKTTEEAYSRSKAEGSPENKKV